MTHTVPENDNVIRYVGFTKLDKYGKAKSVAFTPDPEQHGVSVRWLEHSDILEKKDQLNLVRDLLKLRIGLGATAKLAQLNVGKTMEMLKDGIDEWNSNTPKGQISCKFWFEKTPLGNEDGKPEDPSHCDIVFYPVPPHQFQRNAIGAILCQSVIQYHPARP